MATSYIELQRIFGNSWFGSLRDASQEALLTKGRSMKLSPGECLVRKGDAANGFFGVVSGVLAASSLLEDGRQMIFGLIEAGDWCGEASSLDHLPRTHDIRALNPAELLHIGQPLFDQLMHDTHFARAIAVLQTTRIRTMFSFFEDAALRSTRARVARRLLRLASGDATPVPKVRQTLPVTHETLAMMLGITRQTLSLELKALAAEGAVALSYGRIDITSAQKLRLASGN